MKRIILTCICITLNWNAYCQKQILLRVDSNLTNANLKINTIITKIDSNANYLSRFDAYLIKISQNSNETDLQKYDQLGSVLGSILSFLAILITIYLGYLTYNLTVKYGENQSELEVLRRAYLDTYIPYVDVTNVEFKDNYIVFRIQNLGGFLENLEIKVKNDSPKTAFSLDFGEHFPKNMGRFGSFQKQIFLPPKARIGGTYELTYKNRFQNLFKQELLIHQTKGDIKFEVTPPELLHEGINVFNN